MIEDVVSRTNERDTRVLLLEVCKELSTLYGDSEELERYTSEVGLSTTMDIQKAITNFFLMKDAQRKKETTGIRLTEGAMGLIESVVARTNLTDTNALVPEVCKELQERFGDGNSLEYHAAQMNLATTEGIQRAIGCFFISKQLFPDKSYLHS